jgi:hypothetical protein
VIGGEATEPNKMQALNMNKIKQSIILGIAAFLMCAMPSTPAQLKNSGKLNTWTTKPVERRHENDQLTRIRTVRAASHKGFDRIVFEFAGPIPNYSVEYHPSKFYEDEGGRHRIKIAGGTYVHVNLNLIPVNEEQLRFSQASDFAPKGRLKLPVLWEVDEAGFFEGHYDFLLGIKSRRLFRVTELQNPARLAVDFKQ